MSLIEDEMPFMLTLIWNLKMGSHAGTSRKFCQDFKKVLKVADDQIVTESTKTGIAIFLEQLDGCLIT